MSKPVQGLSDDQRMALMKFRRKVSDIINKEDHDDYFLMRWLKARNWNSDAAEKMLRDSMSWRVFWKVDTLKDWKAPEVLVKYFPSGLSGYDKDGAPVIILPFIGLDITGLLHSANKNDFFRTVILYLENYLEIAKQQRKLHGEAASQVIGIIDMEGFSIKPFLWRPAAEAVITLIKMYEANYPEILKICYIINAPKVFSLAFNVVKGFMNEITISKIQIMDTNRNKWQKAILKQVPASQLPKHYGGEQVDPDGDPRCPSRIRQGGKVDKEYYLENVDGPQEDYQEVTINRGDKFTIDFHCSESGCFLKWDFKTEGHDIAFGVEKKNKDGSKNVVIPTARVGANHFDEIGFIETEPDNTYTVIFDNSYSVLRNKKLQYSVMLTPPVNPEITNQENEISSF
ncbi:SEC14-like protein 2 [Ctenocephalides felis]|uniref:SEC14-like protein 2 n=2 Tax=Ctenocephalides felis TaxID=7515 RepID=UPI000E6E28CF|nr:SEC14-like protein 2 [Ctenocephalides felis]